MYRVLRPGGQLLLLDHVAAANRIQLALQRLWEKVTLRFAGDYQTRHPLPLVEQAGFVVTDSLVHGHLVDRACAGDVGAGHEVSVSGRCPGR